MAEEAGKAVFRIVIAGTMESVFREITKTDELQGAVFNARLVTDAPGLVRGRRMQMRTGSGRRTLVVGEVVECTPPSRYAHTHRFTQYDDPATTVTWELRQVDGGVEVTLTVDHVTPGTKTESEMRRGGDFMLRTLKAIVETGRPPLGTRLLYAAFGAMEFVLPARTKSEHWPLDRP